MPQIKLKINLIDKREIFPLKAKYDPETRLAQVKRALRQQFPTRFQIDPNHIYKCKRQAWCFVDNASRKSIEMERAKIREVTKETVENGKKIVETTTETVPVKETIENVGVSHQVHTDNPVDGKQKNTLDFLIEEKFWKSLIAKQKLPLSTILILLAGGMGLLTLVVLILKMVFGYQLGI
jgi:hypothetical protein